MSNDLPALHVSNPHTPRLLRLQEVIGRVGLPRSSLYQQMAEGSFPKPVPIGIRSRGWVESEIDTWIAARIQARHSNRV